MSSIHYKFKATLEYKTLVFDGLHISVNELKKEICEKENIKAESFDLLLTNAHTKRQYSSDELIPRNSSVVVQRTPRDNAAKLPKVQDTTNSGVISRTSNVDTSFVPHIEPEQFNKMTEEERLAHVKAVSASKYQPANFQRRASVLTGPPPPTYICNRCSQPGHWYKNCPMLNTRRTTGITMDELMETTADDPLAMLHPSGKYVVPIMHWKARQQKKVESGPTIEAENRVVPAELSCPLCGQLLRDAVLATCCGDSFCAECVQQQLLDSSNAKCPGANCSQTAVSADKLVPNLKMRQAVESFKSMGASASGNAVSKNVMAVAASATVARSPPVDLSGKTAGGRPEETAPPQVARVRIGLSNRAQATQPSALPPPAATAAAATPPQSMQVEVPPTPPVPAAPRPAAFPTEMESPPVVVPPPAAAPPPQVPVPPTIMPPSLPMPPPIEPRMPPPIVPMQQVPMPMLTVNVHQPPPGYAPIPPQLPARTSTEPNLHPRPLHSTSVENVIVPTSAAQPVLIQHQQGVQPPPPGLPAATSFPTVAAPPPIRDAWDEFLERREEKDRQRAAASRTRHRRSTRSSSYSSSSSSSGSSSESRSRSRSRSWSRERSTRERNNRSSRERRSNRRKSPRSPPRVPYAAPRLHPAPTFGLYQHPPPGPFSMQPPSASFSHHRIPQVVSGFPPPPSFVPVQANPMPNYAPFTTSASAPGTYRPLRNFNDDRTARKRSPRYNEPERRSQRHRSGSRERENERERKDRARAERVEESKKYTRDIDERIRPPDDRVRPPDERAQKYRPRETKEPRHAKHSVGSSKRRREKEETRNDEISRGPPEKEPTIEAVPPTKTVDDWPSNEGVSHEVSEKPTIPLVVPTVKTEEVKEEEKEAPTVENVEQNLPIEEPANANGLENAEESEEHGKSEKKKKKRKKLKRKHRRDEKEDEEREKKKHHRHHNEEGEEERERHKKSKKHKRSREEKEKKKEEREKRREERRRRRELEGNARVESLKAEADTADGAEEVASREGATSQHTALVGTMNGEEVVKRETIERTVPDEHGHELNVKDRYEKERTLKQELVERDMKGEVEGGPKSSEKNNEMERGEKVVEERKGKEVASGRSDERAGKRERTSSNRTWDKRIKAEDGEDGKRRDATEEGSSRKRPEKSAEGATRSSRHSEKNRSDYHSSKEGHDSKLSAEETEESRTSREADRSTLSKERTERVKSTEQKSEMSDDKRTEKRKSEIERNDMKRSRESHDGEKSREKKSRDEDRKSSAKSDSAASKSEKVSEKSSKSEGKKSSQRKEKGKDKEESEKGSRRDKEKEREKEKEAERKRLDEIKISIEKELAGDKKSEAARMLEGRKDKPNITIEVKGEKRITRENVFESSLTPFNARQKIKMILLPESERFAAEKAKKKAVK